MIVGDITRPKDRQPFVGIQPKPHKSTPLATAMAAFTLLQDPEETEAWQFVSEWMRRTVFEAGVIRDEDDKTKPASWEVVKIKVGKLVLPPKTEGHHPSLSLKLQTGAASPSLSPR